MWEIRNVETEFSEKVVNDLNCIFSSAYMLYSNVHKCENKLSKFGKTS